MKKMHVNSKDRIICVTTTDQHEFFYQPYKSNTPIFLFRTQKFFGSVFAHFHNKGRAMSVKGWGITCGELYKFDRRNFKLTEIMERIAGTVNYVVANELWRYETGLQHDVSKSTTFPEHSNFDEDRVA